MSQPRCLKKALEGDRDALEELAGFCYPAVFGYLTKLSGSRARAQDLAQDVMVRMLESLETYRPRADSGFLAWVFRIARNRFIDDARSRSRWQLQPLDESSAKPAVGSDTTSVVVLARMETDTLARALAALPGEDAELLQLRYYFSFSHREAAEILGVKPPIVKSRLNAALSRLRKQYANLEKGNGNGE